MGLNGATGFFFQTFGVLFAVLQLISGFTMYQQCMKATPNQTVETIAGILKVTLAFGLLAFGFSCRHIHVGLPPDTMVDAKALVIAIESFVIINFFMTLFCHCAARRFTWDSPSTDAKKMSPMFFAIAQTVLSIVLIGLLAAEAQDLTGQTENDSQQVAKVGLNDAGLYMLLFGLIFAVFEAAAGFTMIEQMTKKLAGSSANLVFVTNKVALAIGLLAMGFACRHIYLGLKNGAPDGASDHNVQLVHAIESFLIINFFLTWAIQWRSVAVDW